MINSIIFFKKYYLPIPDFEYSYNKYLHDGIFDNFKLSMIINLTLT